MPRLFAAQRRIRACDGPCRFGSAKSDMMPTSFTLIFALTGAPTDYPMLNRGSGLTVNGAGRGRLN
jgi:hypothetical protein